MFKPNMRGMSHGPGSKHMTHGFALRFGGSNNDGENKYHKNCNTVPFFYFRAVGDFAYWVFSCFRNPPNSDNGLLWCEMFVRDHSYASVYIA